MTPREALNQRVRDARRFRYVPDAAKTADWIEQVLADHFQTANETEARGQGDCEDYASWTIQRGYDLALDFTAPGESPGEWRMLLGAVYQQGVWSGHAWPELIEPDGRRVWADPTWGWRADDPAMLGFPATRTPRRGFRFNGMIYEGPIAYEALL